jgi:quaternary ammonium compound-resistance protein SugE
VSSNFISWSALLFAGLFEVVWAYYLKSSKGLTLLTPSILFVITLFISMALLAYSVRTIPLGIAYPVWTGIGAIGAVIAGAVFFREEVGVLKFVFLALILIGIIGLKMSSKQ